MKKEFVITFAAGLGFYFLLAFTNFVDAGRWQTSAGILGFYMGPVLILAGAVTVLFQKSRMYGAGLIAAGLVILLLGYYFCSTPMHPGRYEQIG